MITNFAFPVFNSLPDNHKASYAALRKHNHGKFKVVDKQLVSLSTGERCSEFFKGVFISVFRSKEEKDAGTETQEKVKTLITDLLKECKDGSFEEQRNFVQLLGRLSPKVFDRTALRTAGFYKSFMDKTKQQISDDADQDAYWNTIAEAQIADWAGIRCIRNEGGTSGNYRLKNLDGKTVALFKPSSESPHGKENPYLTIRIRNFFQKCLFLRHGSSFPQDLEAEGHLREVFASEVVEILGWKTGSNPLIPKARVGKFESQSLYSKTEREGSIQLWMEKCEDGHSRVLKKRLLDHTKPLLIATAICVTLVALSAIAAAIIFVPGVTALCTAAIIHVALSAFPIISSLGFLALLIEAGVFVGWVKEKIIQKGAQEPNETSFAQAALLAYLLCNLDFNPGNMLFPEGESGEMYLIDFWFSMPRTHPKIWLDVRNMHLWKRLKIADTEISKKVVEDISKHFNQIVKRANVIFGQTSGEVTQLTTRWSVIQRMADQKKMYKELAKTVTIEQMQDAV